MSTSSGNESTTIPPPDEDASTSTSDRWRATSKGYSQQMAQQFQLTTLYAHDMITVLDDRIRLAKTILDIGCGTGAFVHAYIRQFPHGIVGQTIISSDISPSMIQQAQQDTMESIHAIEKNTNETFATNLLFQLEDGSQLSGITDHSIDLVVSLYGVFLIPNQVDTLQSIRRVLKPETGIFANAAWTKHDGIHTSFGGNLQDVFFQLNHAAKDMVASGDTFTDTSSAVTSSGKDVLASGQPPSFLEWVEPTKILNNLTQQGFINVRTYRMFHSMICNNVHIMFDMCIENPMIKNNTKDLSPEQIHQLKHLFVESCQIPNSNDNERDRIVMMMNDVNKSDMTTNDDVSTPFTLWSAANITISHAI